MVDLGSLTLPSSQALSAITVLGTLCTGLVYFLYMALIQKAGPTFASFSNYLVPLFGVMLGALFLGEQIHPTTGVALALILGSVAMNQWAQQRRVHVRQPYVRHLDHPVRRSGPDCRLAVSPATGGLLGLLMVLLPWFFDSKLQAMLSYALSA